MLLAITTVIGAAAAGYNIRPIADAIAKIIEDDPNVQQHRQALYSAQRQRIRINEALECIQRSRLHPYLKVNLPPDLQKDEQQLRQMLKACKEEEKYLRAELACARAHAKAMLTVKKPERSAVQLPNPQTGIETNSPATVNTNVANQRPDTKQQEKKPHSPTAVNNNIAKPPLPKRAPKFYEELDFDTAMAAIVQHEREAAGEALPEDICLMKFMKRSAEEMRFYKFINADGVQDAADLRWFDINKAARMHDINVDSLPLADLIANILCGNNSNKRESLVAFAELPRAAKQHYHIPYMDVEMDLTNFPVKRYLTDRKFVGDAT